MKRLYSTILVFIFIVGSAFTYAETPTPRPAVRDSKQPAEGARGGDGDEIKVVDRPLLPEYERAKRVYTHLALATYLQTVDKLSSAKRAYELVLQEHETSAFVHTQLASLSMAMQDIRTAEQECRRAIEIQPQNPTPHFTLGQILLRRSGNSTEKWTEAIAEFQKVIELEPNYVDAYRYLGEISEYRQDYASAIHAFKELTRVMPYQPQFYLRLGNAYNQSGNKQEAIAAYERAIKIDRDIGQAYEALGRLHIEEFDQIFSQPESTADELEVATEKLDKAILAYTEMRRLAPPADYQKYDELLRHFRARLGSLYVTIQKYEKAVEVLQKVLADDSENVDANYWIGIAYQALGDFDKAEQYLSAVMALAPERDEVYNALGYLWADRGTKLDEAVALIQKALQKSPENGAYLDSLGWAYFKQGKLEAALAELEKAIRYMPESAEIQDHVGEVYLKKGLVQKAVSAWQKAIQLEPDNVKIQEKLKLHQEE